MGFRYLVLDREIVENGLLLMGEKGERSQKVFDIQKRINQEFGQPICVGGALVVWDLWNQKKSEIGSEQFEYLWQRTSVSPYEQRLFELERVPK